MEVPDELLPAGLLLPSEAAVPAVVEVDAQEGGNLNDQRVQTASAADQILPHQHPQPVAVVVPPQGLHLDVLAEHVEPAFLHLPDVVDHGLVGGRGIEPVAPIPLVQHAGHEDGTVVEGQDLFAVHGGYAELPHPKVALHLVPALQGDGNIVEEGVLRGPGAEVFVGDGELLVFPGGVVPVLGDDHAVLAHHHVGPLRVLGLEDQAHPLVIQIRDNGQLLHIVLRHRLQPHRLPDAALGGVPDAAGTEALLAVGVAGPGGGVGDGHRQGVLHLRESVCDITGEGQIASLVAPCETAVDVDLTGLVHRPEMEQHPVLPEALRQGEGPAVPQPVLRHYFLHHAGQEALRGEGDDNLAVIGVRLLLLPVPDGVLPAAVEVKIAVPAQLGTGILRQGTLPVQIFPPGGQHGPQGPEGPGGLLPPQQGQRDGDQQQHQCGGDEDFRRGDFLHHAQLLIGLPAVLDHRRADIRACHHGQQHLEKDADALELSRLMGGGVVPDETLQAGGEDHAGSQYHRARQNNGDHTPDEEHGDEPGEGRNGGGDRHMELSVPVDYPPKSHAGHAGGGKHHAQNHGVAVHPKEALDIDDEVGHIHLLAGGVHRQSQQGQIQGGIGPDDPWAQAVEDVPHVVALRPAEVLRLLNEQMAQAASQQGQSAHHKEEDPPLPLGGQAVQSAEDHQHGHQRHDGQHRLHPAPVAVSGDVCHPGVEGRVVGAAAEKGHHAVQNDHQHRRRLDRLCRTQQAFQTVHPHQGEGHDAQAPQQVARDDDGLAHPQFVRQRAHRQGGHRRHHGAGRHHGGDHARVPGNGVVEEHIEIHVLHHPGDLADESEAQQCCPDPHAQGALFLLPSHCLNLLSLKKHRSSRPKFQLWRPPVADSAAPRRASGPEKTPRRHKPQYVVLYNPGGYPASSV